MCHSKIIEHSAAVCQQLLLLTTMHHTYLPPCVVLGPRSGVLLPQQGRGGLSIANCTERHIGENESSKK